MERAWRARRRLGGGMRQAGLLAAAALYGLRDNFALLAEDHRRARELAARAARCRGWPRTRRTPTSSWSTSSPRLAPAGLLAGLAARGVDGPLGARRLRAVTHLDVDDEGIERAGEALGGAVAGLRGDGVRAWNQ